MKENNTTPKAIEHFCEVKGNVVGYLERKKGFQYSHPITPATVLLLAAVNTRNGKELIFPVPDNKLGILRKSKRIKGLTYLMKENESVACILQDLVEFFSPFEIAKNNTSARFKFDKVPIGSFDYVVCAIVENKVYFSDDTMGNNGSGEPAIILKDYLLKSENSVLDGIIIPVFDKWSAKIKVPKVKIIESDKGMNDPEHVRSLLGGDL